MAPSSGTGFAFSSAAAQGEHTTQSRRPGPKSTSGNCASPSSSQLELGTDSGGHQSLLELRESRNSDTGFADCE